MASSGSKKYHWTDVQLYALGLAGQNASNQDKTTDVQLGMEIANTYKQHLQRALADMLVSWEDVHTYSLDDLVQVRRVESVYIFCVYSCQYLILF
jgi:hypothetical protein